MLIQTKEGDSDRAAVSLIGHSLPPACLSFQWLSAPRLVILAEVKTVTFFSVLIVKSAPGFSNQMGTSFLKTVVNKAFVASIVSCGLVHI